LWTTLTLLAALGAGGAKADVFDALETVAEADLEAARGGFVTTGGAVVSLGVELRTLVDGGVALETSIMAGPAGLSVVERVAPGLSAAQAADLQAAAARGLDVRGLSGQRVFLVSGGETAVAHRITGDALQNLIVNAADGLDLRQAIDVRVVLDAQALQADQAALAGLRAGLEHADLVRAGLPF
jgi:hypothetical protein